VAGGGEGFAVRRRSVAPSGLKRKRKEGVGGWFRGLTPPGYLLPPLRGFDGGSVGRGEYGVAGRVMGAMGGMGRYGRYDVDGVDGGDGSGGRCTKWNRFAMTVLTDPSTLRLRSGQA